MAFPVFAEAPISLTRRHLFRGKNNAPFTKVMKPTVLSINPHYYSESKNRQNLKIDFLIYSNFSNALFTSFLNSFTKRTTIVNIL